MKKFITVAALALLFSGPVHAGFITIDEVNGNSVNQLEFGNWAATQRGSYELEGSGGFFTTILGVSYDGLAYAGSGTFVGSDWLSVLGFADSFGNASASSSSSGFIDFIVGSRPVELILSTMLYGDASFTYGISRNSEAFRLSWNGLAQNGWYQFGLTANATAVPEPGTFALLGAGLLGLCWVRRRREVAI